MEDKKSESTVERVRRQYKEGKVFRGTFQSGFEMNVIQGIPDGEPSYFGTINRSDELGKITATSWSIIVASCFPICDGRRPPRGFAHGFWPFSPSPLLMEIDMGPYSDKCFHPIDPKDKNYPLSEKEVVIKGPISLDHIRILYSSHIDRLSETNLRVETQDKIRQEFRVRMGEFRGEYGSNVDKDLISNFERNPPKVTDELCVIAYGPRFHPYNREEVNKVKRCVEMLRGKLR